RFSTNSVPSNQNSIRSLRHISETDEEEFQDFSSLHPPKNSNRSRSSSHSSNQPSPRSKGAGLGIQEAHQLFTWMTLALKYDATSRHKQVTFSQTSELFEFLLDNKVASTSWPDFISKALETNQIPRQMLKNASTRFTN